MTSRPQTEERIFGRGPRSKDEVEIEPEVTVGVDRQLEDPFTMPPPGAATPPLPGMASSPPSPDEAWELVATRRTRQTAASPPAIPRACIRTCGHTRTSTLAAATANIACRDVDQKSSRGPGSPCDTSPRPVRRQSQQGQQQGRELQPEAIVAPGRADDHERGARSGTPARDRAATTVGAT